MPCTASSSTEMQIGAREVEVQLRTRARAVRARRRGRRPRRARGAHSRGGRGGSARGSSRRRRAGRPQRLELLGSLRWTPCHPHISHEPALAQRPSRGDVLELTVDRSPTGATASHAWEGYVVFVAGALPGDRVRAVVGKAKKAYAEARAIEMVQPSPDRIPAVADHPGAPWQVLPYERQLAVKAEQVRGRAAPDRPARGLRARADRARGRAVALPQQARVLVRDRPDGELVLGFHAPGRWNEIVAIDDCKLASERGNELREQALACCRKQGLERVGPARPARLPAQPRRARGAQRRARRRCA